MAQKTLIGGTGYEIINGRTSVGGTGYVIAKGRALVSGTGYDIDFCVPIGDLDVGKSVYIYINGVETEFLVVNQGIPGNSDLYDASCDGTWLLAKNILENRVVQRSSDQYYAGSSIHEYLNGDFLELLDDRTQDAIMQVKIPYCVDTDHVANGSDGLSSKVFLLSYAEINSAYGSPANEEGHELSYFDTAYSAEPGANTHLIATLNGIAGSWMVRTIGSASAHYCGISATGAFANHEEGNSVGIRPAMIMPFETRVAKTSHRVMG